MPDPVIYVDAAEDKRIRDLRSLSAAGLRKLVSLIEEDDREAFAEMAVILRRMADAREVGNV